MTAVLGSQELIDVVVRDPGRLNAEELCQHLRPAAGRVVLLDLEQLRFSEPAGIVSLAVLSDLATSVGRSVEFRAPANENSASYLARMRLGQHLDRLGIAHRLPPVNERDLGARLVELRRFDGAAGLEGVIDALVQTYVETQPDVVQPLYTALHEIASNVIHHSGRSHGYAALQRFDASRDVVFAVADGGIGLRARLATRFAVPDDRRAIARAVQTHISTMSEAGRGRGIARVIAVTGQRRGAVTLLSGSARAVFTRGDPRPQFGDCLTPHPGTLVTARLSL
jgi:hypothetical protein